MRNINQSENGFVQRKLPWILASAALLLYLITLTPWLTLRGLPTLAKAAGWDWRPDFISPLTFLITLPVRWFPVGWQPAVANFISAACAALTLALLGRSVAILPHDRTREQRHYERSEHSILSMALAWLPPAFAVLVLGLQMTFWEHAVVLTGEMVDVLVFAYLVRSLLEFRLDRKESWLIRGAFIYGMGMANNFALIPFLPFFVGALIWIRMRAFFDTRFLLRLATWGLAGMSLYLLLPVINLFTGSIDMSLWAFLKINLGLQKNALLGFPRYLVFLLALVSVLPVIFMGIKWPASFGDINAAGAALTNLMSHVIHAVFLLACLYVAFDPPFSPRSLGQGFAFLPLIYLSALSIGYYAGYFLLVFDPKATGPLGRRSPLRKGISYALTVLVWAAAVLAPLRLAISNYGQIRAEHGPELSEFGKRAANSLPTEGGLVFSDDPLRLYAVHSALAREHRLEKYILLDTTSLTVPAYHQSLAARYKTNWPVFFNSIPSGAQVEPVALVQLIQNFLSQRPVYYLHPSFGYYFEALYAVPHKGVFQLLPYATNAISAPLLSQQQIEENDAYWQQLRAGDLKDLPAAVKHCKAKTAQGNAAAVFTGVIYSQAINEFGVELQKRGDFQRAGRYFDYALELNPDNVTAIINSEYNNVLQAGGHEGVPPSPAVTEKLRLYNANWETMVSYNGPVDEPNSCYLFAEMLAKGRNFRQSAQYLERTCSLTPSNISAQLALASVFVQANQPDYALRKVQEIQAFPALTEQDQMLLAECQAWAHLIKGEFPVAEKTLKRAQEEHPSRSEPFKALAEMYLSRRDWTNAATVLNRLIEAQPDNTEGLIDFAALKIRMGAYQEAIPPLERALKLQPENFYALLNHGIACLQLTNLDAARHDYELLERRTPKPLYAVHYALGEIAYQKKQKKTALEHYEKYLELAPRGTAEMQAIQVRVHRLKSGASI